MFIKIHGILAAFLETAVANPTKEKPMGALLSQVAVGCWFLE